LLDQRNGRNVQHDSFAERFDGLLVVHAEDGGMVDDDKENVQNALIEGMDRAFSQEEFQASPTFACAVAVRRVQQQQPLQSTPRRTTDAWCRTTSLPSQPSMREKTALPSLLGKRDHPSSPATADDDKSWTGNRCRSDSADAAVVTSSKPKAVASMNGSPHKRSAVLVASARPNADATLASRPFSRTISEQNNRLRRPINASHNLQRAPRVGLSRASTVGTSTRPVLQSTVDNKPASAVLGPVAAIKAPFKQPTRRSPRKQAPVPAFQPRPIVHVIDDDDDEVNMVVNRSFDDDIDEAALCQALDEIEASQKSHSFGRATEPVSRSIRLSHRSPAPLPQSDDSFEASIDEDVSAAILSQMDAQGW
jgi:hypothetical protein